MARPLLCKGYTNNNENRPGDSNPVLAEDKREGVGLPVGGGSFVFFPLD